MSASPTAAAAGAGGGTMIEIAPPRAWVPVQWRELWAYRELLYFLIWRDITVRYKQTVLGVLWVIVQPVLLVLVFNLFFGRLAGVPTDGLPYPLFSMAGLLPWQLFSRALAESGNSVVSNQALITKVYFPRLLVPMAAVLASLADFVIGFILVVALMATYGVGWTPAILAVPGFVLLAVLAALAAGLWLSALNVRYRDVRHVIPFLTQCWMFLTPVAYAMSLVPERWQWLYWLNPMTSVVEGFRWAVLGRTSPPGAMTLACVGMIAVWLVGGVWYFRRTEQGFADVI